MRKTETIDVPFVGVIKVTVQPLHLPDGALQDAVIDGMRKHLSTHMAKAWMPPGSDAPTPPLKVEVAELFETYRLYIGAAPNRRERREQEQEWKLRWASAGHPAPDEPDEDDETDDVLALIEELHNYDIQATRHHTGGGFMVAEIELDGGYFLSSSQPDGPQAGYYWGIEDHSGDLLLQGEWPQSDAAEAARQIAQMIGAFGSITARR